ncbi:hypothetical protein H110_04516, partial [Trichophyton rubrum MR1448]
YLAGYPSHGDRHSALNGCSGVLLQRATRHGRDQASTGSLLTARGGKGGSPRAQQQHRQQASSAA